MLSPQGDSLTDIENALGITPLSPYMQSKVGVIKKYGKYFNFPHSILPFFCDSKLFPNI